MKNKSKMLAIILGVLGLICVVLFFVFGMLKKETYTIIFNTNGGSVIDNITIEDGKILPRPIDPVKEGYQFIQWNYNNVPYDFSQEVKSNLTLDAIWEEVRVEPDKYEVTFTIGDVTKTVEVSQFSEINFDELGFEEKAGHAIKWYVGDEEYDETKQLMENIKLTGKYVKVSSFVVKFNSNGGTAVKEQTIKDGEKVSEPTNVTKEGYVLDGWFLNSEKYDFNTKVNKNFTLTAKWSEDPNVKRYTVSFNSDGGSKVESQRVMENKTAKEPKAPTKKNFVFVSWIYNDKDKFDFKTKITEDIELKANWRPLEKYTVTFKMDDGRVIQSNEVTEGGTVSEPSVQTKTGYVFREWQLDGNKYVFSTSVTKNITITAVYDEEKKVENYRVEFNTAGGTPSVTTQIIEAGRKAIEPTVNPSKDGWTFDGWVLEGTDTKFNFNTLISRNIKLVASYKRNEVTKYTVTFNSMGGSAVPSQEVNAGGTATEPTAPTKTGSTFAGWQLNNSPYVFSTPVNSNIELIATWNTDTYTISYNCADNMSCAEIRLIVKKNGNIVTSIVNEIKDSEGNSLCISPNLATSKGNFDDTSSFIIIFNDNTQAIATKE